MGREINRLAAVSLKSLGVGKYDDGSGLRFIHRNSGSRAWVFRYTIHGRRREMGLGAYPAISLKAARALSAEFRSQVQLGIDPIAKREADRREARRNLHRLRDVALACFDARKAELKNERAQVSWFSPIEIHVLPKLGNVPVSDIDQVAVKDVLAPIWNDKAETARKAANRLGIILQHAAAMGLTVDLQAVDKARALLGKQRHEAKRIPAMPWRDVPAFYASLGKGITELALRLLILTGVRSAPIRFATPDQFDLESSVWTVPAAHMKGRAGATSDFRVPLTGEAIEVIHEAQRHGGQVLFPGNRGRPISDMTMAKLMRVRGLESRPHGFRSSLRTWAEETGQRFEVAESALGHVVGNKVERAYQRSDLLEKRRTMMAAWSDHVTGNEIASVVKFSKAQV